MSVDLEDYYYRMPFEKWDSYESRIEISTNKILDLFEKYNVRATFFTLVYIAKPHPELIEKIVRLGYEVASHSYAHKEVKNMTKKDFEKDLVESLEIIRKISGEKPLGFRAPRFSINKNCFWAFSILKKYLVYDSSIYPVNYLKYGNPDAPRNIYSISDENPFKEDKNSDFLEIPLATLHIPSFGNFPIAGGFYLRLLPIEIISWGIKKLNKSGNIAMCYIHPHDLDPEKPNMPNYPWHTNFKLKSSLKKFESLLKNYSFSSVRDEILNL